VPWLRTAVVRVFTEGWGRTHHPSRSKLASSVWVEMRKPVLGAISRNWIIAILDGCKEEVDGKPNCS